MYHTHKNKLNFVALICLIFMFFYHFPSSHLTILYIILYVPPLRGMGEGEGGGGTSLNFAFENFKYISISTYKWVPPPPHIYWKRSKIHLNIPPITYRGEYILLRIFQTFLSSKVMTFFCAKTPNHKKLTNKVISNVRKYIFGWISFFWSISSPYTWMYACT